MQPDIRTTPLEYTISGHSLRHDPAKRFGEQILALLGRIWPVIKAVGLRKGWPMIEVYGHWTNDESKLETETFVAVH